MKARERDDCKRSETDGEHLILVRNVSGESGAVEVNLENVFHRMRVSLLFRDSSVFGIVETERADVVRYGSEDARQVDEILLLEKVVMTVENGCVLGDYLIHNTI